MFAVPAFGQVQGEVAAAVAGGAGGDVDEVAADGGAAGFGVAEAGQGAGGAQQVVADGGEASQAALAGNEPEGRWASGPSVQSAKTCSMTAWSRCCSSAWSVANGESVNTAW